MENFLNIPLTDELNAFIHQNSGEGTQYVSPVEFVQEIIREQMLREEAEKFGQGLIEAFEDILAGRVYEYNGNLKELLEKVRE